MKKKPTRFSSPLIKPEDIGPNALRVIQRLQRFGYIAYLVGGSVRDLLLGQRPKDFDVATSARPEEVAAVFRNSRIIGRRFRLAHIHFGEEIIETATFRALPLTADEYEGELIRDDNEFGTPASDARRRDFTINALFYDPNRDEVIDYVGGAEDLDRRLIRVIGDPTTRFREDPVRMLRALKFAGRLGLEIEEGAQAAIRAERLQLSKAAVPRLYEELQRMTFNRRSAVTVELMMDYGMLDLLLPEVAAFLGRPTQSEESPWLPLKALLDALDEREERPLPGVILSALFWPLIQALVVDNSPRWRAKHLHRVIGSVVGAAGIRYEMPRALLEAVMATLEGQFYLERRALGGKKGKRGKKGSRFGHHPFFHQIYDLIQLRAEAEGIDAEALEAWAEIAETAPPPRAPEPPPPRPSRAASRGSGSVKRRVKHRERHPRRDVRGRSGRRGAGRPR